MESTQALKLKKIRFKIINKEYLEPLIFLTIFFGLFGYIASQMGTTNMINTIMKTAHDLLLNTIFFIMSITVITGALNRLMIEFGVIQILEKILSPLMRPIFNLPGVASLGALLTFFSDNPAIITLARDKDFKKYFSKKQLLSLTNFGTSFGMGLIVLAFMMSLGFFKAAIIGLVSVFIGSGISTRLMQFFLKNKLQEEESFPETSVCNNQADATQKNSSNKNTEEQNSIGMRILNAMLDGGQQGVEIGLSIIPGLLVVSSIIMLITFGPANTAIGYQGLAYEGVPLLRSFGSLFIGIFKILFGFKHAELIAFPITSLGSAGASLSIVKTFLTKGLITGNEIAVFTAMGMCWSGFLSTHSAMLDSLNARKFTSQAILAHTIGGLSAGITAHFLYIMLKYLLVI